MSFSQSTMLGDPVFAPSPAGRELLISWASSSAEGTWFQLYKDGSLYWWGTDRSLRLPWSRDPVHVDVGTVLPGEVGVDFSGSLPSRPLDRVRLDWQGGLWEGADIQGFRVYQGLSPGGAVSYAAPVATIPMTVAGVRLDGFGQGGFGVGGFGFGGGTYSWTSDRLAGGVWSFAVAPYDTAGNEDPSPLTVSITVSAPPKPPAPDADGARLGYVFHAGTGGGFGGGGFGNWGFGSGDENVGFGAGGFGGGWFGTGDGAGLPTVTLTWLASPS